MNKFRLLTVTTFLFCVMSFFCASTPLVYDDFGYGSGSSNTADIFSAQIHEHLTWSGKFIGHLMARILLHGPSWLHPVLSPLIFIGSIFSGVILTLGIHWRNEIRSWQVVLLAGLVWLAVPAFGTVYFWRTGTPDYAYSLFFATAFLIPYRFWLDRKDYRLSAGPLYIFAGLLAGWSNENVGMPAALIALSVTLYRFRAAKKFPLWAFAGMLGALSGWLLMMAAPANAIRLARLGGIEKIPAFSAASFQKFLVFWGSQQLEMAPYMLVSLVCIWMLHREGRVRRATILPGLAFFLMSQASLAAFVFSPSTPYRAMTSAFFFQACSCFAFLAAIHMKTVFPRIIYAVFCIILLFSVFREVHIFIQAQPAIAQRNKAISDGTLTAESFNYPRTDKYFFPTYDIIEMNAYPDSQKSRMIPWHKATARKVEEGPSIKLLVISNMVYLSNLPQGKVHVAAVAHRQNLASIIQMLLRYALPSGKTATSFEVATRYAIAATKITGDGKASLHMPGVSQVSDIAYIGIEDAENPLVWKRIAR